MRTRKERASVFIVGCLETNRAMGPAKPIMTPMEMTTAVAMMG